MRPGQDVTYAGPEYKWQDFWFRCRRRSLSLTLLGPKDGRSLYFAPVVSFTPESWGGKESGAPVAEHISPGGGKGARG